MKRQLNSRMIDLLQETEQVELSLGYTFIKTHPEEPYPLRVTSVEHDDWQQALMKFDIGKVHFPNRFRQKKC